MPAPALARPCAFLTLVALGLGPSLEARADGLDAQASSRLTLGGGLGFEGDALEGVFELGARVDLLVGEDRPARVRLGPELELRTATFESIELTAGPAFLFPFGDFALGLVIGAGYAWRLPRTLDASRDGVVITGTLRFGYQPYDPFDAYSMGLHVFATGRAGVQGQERYELTFGVEVDLELIFVAPVMFAVTALSSGDPDEPAPSEAP